MPWTKVVGLNPQNVYNPEEGANKYKAKAGEMNRNAQEQVLRGELPFMAKGWTEKGEPEYGDGFGGFMRKTFATMFDPSIRTETIDKDRQKVLMEDANAVSDRFQQLFPGLKKYDEYLDNLLYARNADVENIRNGNIISPMAKAAGATAKGTLNSAMYLLGQPEQLYRKYVTAPTAALQEAEGTTSKYNDLNNPVLKFFANSAKIANVLNPAKNARTLWQSGVRNLKEGDIVEGASQVALSPIAFLAGPLGASLVTGASAQLSNDKRTQQLVARNQEASQVLYSAIANDAKWAEIERALEAGESQQQIEERLADPWVELGASLVLDPLNFVDVFGGAAKADKFLDTARVSGLMNDAGAIKLMDDAANAGADTVRAMKGFDNAYTRVASLADTNAERLTDLMTKGYKINDLTAAGKRFITVGKTNSFLTGITQFFQKQPEMIAETLQQVIKFTNKNLPAAERMDAFAYLMSSPAGRVALSDNAMTTGNLMNSMLQGEDLAKFVDDIAKNNDTFENLSKFVESRMGNAIDNAFPDIADLRKAKDAVKSGKAVTDDVLRKAAKYDEVAKAHPNVVKLAAIADKGSPIGKIYSATNNFFSGVYMGLSPAFAVRNMLSNTVHVLADQGIETGAKAGAAGVVSMFAPGAWNKRAVSFLDDMYGKQWEKVIGAGEITEDIGKGLFRTVSGNVESTMKRVMAETQVRKIISNALRNGALDGIEELAQKGFSVDEINDLKKLIFKHSGNWKKAYKEFNQIYKNGNALRRVLTTNPPDKVRKFFETFGLGEKLDDAMRMANGSPEEFAKSAKALLDEVIDLANKSKGELASPQTGTIDERLSQGLAEALQASGSRDDKVAALYNHAIAAQQTGRSQAYNAASEALKGAENMAAQSGDIAMMQKVGDAQRALLSLSQEANGQTAKAVNEFRGIVNKAYDAITKGSKPASQTPFIVFKHADGTITKFVPTEEGKYTDQLWKFYFETVNSEWSRFNDQQLEGVYNILGDFYPELSVAEILQKPTEAVAEGKKIFNGLTAFKKGETQGTIDDLMKLAQTMTPTQQNTLPGAVMQNIAGKSPNAPAFIDEYKGWMESVINRWDDVVEVTPLSDEKLKALTAWSNKFNRRMGETKAIALDYAKEHVNFALHAYGDKTYLDTALSFVYPYQYWYNRTYQNWMKRLAYNPALIAAYGKYKKQVGNLHAGMPEWWKYNISTDDIPGIDLENPLYFNLEATINPLNGLTGVDFNDPEKRVDTVTRAIDDMGKFGPSMWTPINWLVAASMYAKGEEEAGQKWAGRLVPFTSTLKAAANLTGIKPQIGEFGKYGEYDPLVNILSGGLDPYERRRVGRALAGMVDDGTISQEQAIDAGYAQSGPIWEQAVQRATVERAPGQLASFLLGVGFKPRTVGDMKVDQFYKEFFALQNMKYSGMNAEDYQDAMATLQKKYPFMDAVLISRKADDERNSALAYNVFGRIPPGKKTAWLEQVGITNDMLNKFYDSKGDFTGWSPTDVQRFMAGVTDMSAMLSLPTYTTKLEWNDAKAAYTGLDAYLKQEFGADINDKIDRYWNLPEKDRKLYMAQNPDIQQAFDAKTAYISRNPMLYKYYGSIEKIERMYESNMYTYLDQKYGADIGAKWDEYFYLKIADPKAATAYYKKHPELKQYSQEKAKLQDQVIRALARFENRVPENPSPDFRQDFTPTNATQQQFLEQNQAQPQMTWEQWQQVLSEPMQRLVYAYFMEGNELPSAAASQLDYDARQYGFEDGDAMLQAIGSSLYR